MLNEVVGKRTPEKPAADAAPAAEEPANDAPAEATPETPEMPPPPPETPEMPQPAEDARSPTPPPPLGGKSTEPIELRSDGADGDHRCAATILPMGATLARFCVDGGDSLVLAMDDWTSDANPCMNCVIGRVAGRAAPTLDVDGKRYELPGCDGGGGGIKPSTCLHGGMRWNKAVWTVGARDAASVTLELLDPAGPFPGDVAARVTYALRGDEHGAELWMTYEAMTTATTPISLTNHAYWNLSGEPTVDDHALTLDCAHYRPDGGGGDGLPGERVPVEKGGPRDTDGKSLGAFIAAQARASPHWPHGEEFEVDRNVGRDPNRVVDGLPPPAAVLSSGALMMAVHTTEPALQTYYATLLAGTAGPAGPYANRAGVCLEAQRRANAPERCLVAPGDTYRQTTVHVFRRLPRD